MPGWIGHTETAILNKCVWDIEAEALWISESSYVDYTWDVSFWQVAILQELAACITYNYKITIV